MALAGPTGAIRELNVRLEFDARRGAVAIGVYLNAIKRIHGELARP